MGNLLKSELFKLRKDRSFKTLSLILIAVSILYPLLIVFDNESEVLKVSDFYIYNVISGNNYVLKLVPCILAGFFISSEYSIGTMKSITASGNSRMRIYLAKLIAFTVGTIVISLILPIVMTGASAIYFGFHHMPELSYFTQTIGLILLYAAGFASIMALFGIIFTDSGKTIGFSLIFFILFDSILYTLSTKISFLKPVFNYSVFKLLLDINNVNSGDIHWFTFIIVPIITFMVFALLGSIAFQKKEIK